MVETIVEDELGDEAGCGLASAPEEGDLVAGEECAIWDSGEEVEQLGSEVAHLVFII